MTGEGARTVEVARVDGTVVPLRAIDHAGGALVLAPRERLPSWAQEVVRTAGVRWRVVGRGPDWSEGRGRELSAAEAAEAWERFAVVWGRGFLAEHFPEGARAFALEGANDGPPTSLEVVRAEFDALAPVYRERIDRQPFQRLLRIRALALLDRRFPRPARLLEIGPGPGTQTLPLLHRGHSILAVDPSKRMLHHLTEGVRRAGLSAHLAVHHGTAGEVIPRLAEEVPGTFDGAFSLFGALSLEPQLDRVVEGMARLLRPGAFFVAGIQNRWALVAALELAVAGRPRAGLTRLRPHFRVEGRRGVLVATPTTRGELGRRAQPYFEVEGASTLSVLLPDFPSPRLERFGGPRGLARLERLDAGLVRLPPLAALADHVVVTLRRRG